MITVEHVAQTRKAHMEAVTSLQLLEDTMRQNPQRTEWKGLGVFKSARSRCLNAISLSREHIKRRRGEK